MISGVFMRFSSDREESDTKFSSVSSRLCLFYGFKTIYEIDAKDCKGQYIMKYTGGSQCALTGETCQIQRDRVRWSKCSLENKEELIGSLGTVSYTHLTLPTTPYV